MPAVEPYPLTAALDAVSGKWKLIIVYWLAHGRQRFSDLQCRMPAITHKVLSDALRQLQDDGLVAPAGLPRGSAPGRVQQYSLTSHGQTVLPLVEAIRQWGHLHLRR